MESVRSKPPPQKEGCNVDTHPEIKIISLFSGIGGLDLGVSRALKRIGLSPLTLAYVEGEAYAASILVKQMEKGNLDEAPIWSDIKSFQSETFQDADLIIGGYPCQPFSVSGKRRGREDPRHLWPYVLQVLTETRAPLLFVENVRGHISKGLREVLGQLSCFRFDAEWDVFSAEEEGFPHRRERLFLLAYANGERLEAGGIQSRLEKKKPKPSIKSRPWETIEPGICRSHHGIPNRVDRIRSLGNSVVSDCAETAFLELNKRIQQ